MIKEIHMKNCATYDDEGVSIFDCQKVNFIYGPNGSGKSTISNFLQDLADPLYASSEVIWSSEIHPDIMVYNRRFREKNFSNSTDIAGVFTLGSATIQEKKHLEELKDLRQKRIQQYNKDKQSYDNWIKARNTVRVDFRDTVWNIILKERGKAVQEAFTGFRSNKDRFRDQVIERYKKCHSSPYTYDQLAKRYESLYSATPEQCNTIRISNDSIVSSLNSIESDPVFNKVIVGNKDIPIGKLISVLQNGDWVNKGRSYINQNNICPFCQHETIDDNFRRQLEDFFGGEYESSMKLLGMYANDYEKHTSVILSALKSIPVNKSQCQIGKLDEVVFNAKLQSLAGIFLNNLSAIREKMREPGKTVTLDSTKSLIAELKQMIENANLEIDQHNKMVENLSKERTRLSDDMWSYFMCEQEALIAGYINDEEHFAKSAAGMQKKLLSLNKEINDLNNQIIVAGRNITSIQPTVDEINRSLAAYGFTNFRIAKSPLIPNTYQIQRLDGSLVSNTLSEGEETFIAFLYFMQLAKGSINASSVSNKRILVFDDPICSLDSTILYVVSAMIKELIRSIKKDESMVEQVFILTHNVFFHKEASFVDGRSNPESTVNFWVLRKNGNISSITSHGRDNPIQTSYALLWKELQSCESASIITVQNTMRRIIENYFGLLGGIKEDSIVGKFPTIEEQMICRSLFHWINDGSHSIPDDLYFDNHSYSVDKYKEIFKKIFTITNHEAHYNMMMGS